MLLFEIENKKKNQKMFAFTVQYHIIALDSVFVR